MLATQTAITTTSNTVTDTLSSSNECPTIQQQQQQQQQQHQQQQPLHLYRNKNGESSSNGSTANTNNSTHIKLERRDSSTSESSLEHLDLGRTPKKFNKATTSTPFVPNDKSTTTTKPTIINDSIQPLQTVHLQQRLQESDDGNDYDDEESSDEKHTRNVHTSSVITQNLLQQSEPQRLTHYKRRYCGRNLLDKRTSIQLEYNPDNPNSLRKKFRFNRSSSENVTCSNESGFVEGSHSSLLINNSSITNSHSHSKSNTSSAASTPPYNQQNGGISSPESGVGEREDMKYVCPICEVVSPTPHEFTNHIRCHNYASGDTENFTCRICSKVLSSASSLDRHVLVHTGERPFNCKYCHLTFTTNGNMHRHMRTHKQHQHTHHRRNSNGTKIISSSNNNNNYNNNKNGAAVVTSAAASIIAATTQNNINANAAGILNNPSTTTTLPAYATAASNGPSQEGVKSSAINNYNTGNIDAVDHYSSNALSTGGHGNGQRLNGLTNFESYESDGGCSSDNSTVNSQLSQNNNHNNDSNNNNNINNNDIKLNNNNFKRKLLDDHRDFDDRTIELKRCLNSDIINGSVVMPEPPTPNDTCGLVCPACNDNDFSNMLDLDNHMDSKHPDIPAKCKYCEVIFRTHHQLNIHPCTDELAHRLAYANKMNVTRSLPLGEHCSNDTAFAKDDHAAGESQLMEESENQRKEFFRQFYMNKTITEANTQYQRVHEQSSQPDAAEDDVKSEPSAHDSKDLADIQSILNMTSSSSTSNFLKNFEQNVNTPSSQCSYDKDEEEAQDAFTSEFRKMKLRGEFPCKLCTAVFPNLRALKGHNRVHLSEAGLSGPFRCNMCPYSNCDKAALVRHMRTHNGDRPYECAVCNYAFTTKANCERHLRNRHAKTTREEVKRAIIYHPSEDSSCDDPTKKLHMFSSPECDDDNELIMCHTIQPKDRSTPVSHLKEMLTAGESLSAKPVKIQVKSLEQLLDKSSAYQESYEQEKNNISSNNESNGPIDMSMDALDLSKKSSTNQQKKHADQDNQAAANTFNRPAQEPKPVYVENEPINLENPKYEVSALEKQQQQQLFLAQQQLLTNPTQYLQQLYRNLMLPQLSPFFLPNSFMPNSNLAELQKFAPFLSRMFGTPTPITAPLTAALNEDIEKASLANSSNAMNSLLPQISPLMCSEKCSPNSLNSLPSPKDMQAPNPATLNIPLQSLPLALPPPPPPPPHLTSTMLSNAPVKMVLKNGVFMPKQKQRRYRTERPFACEHCSARFTLRSNMERHVKQQHPQYYAQRQRTGHNVMRGRGASNAGNLNSITHLQAAFAHNGSPAGLSSSSPISDQVKYAILAQQLKARKETDLLHQALSHGSGNVNNNNHMFHISPSNGPNGLNFINSNTSNTPNGSMEDDEDKLIIDEDGEDIIDDVPVKNDGTENRNENPSEDNITVEINEENYGKTKDSENHAENVTKSILEQAIKAGHGHGCVSKAELKSVPAPNTMNSMIAQAPAVGKFLKEVASSPFKDESQDLVSVSKLVDNATSNSVSFNNYFRPSDLTNQMEHSDEEGLVASGSASESNNSGAEDTAVVAVQPKKKSAYSLAPNRVSCPYCQRMFPWSSSLRRHILTHTGQKPFKCSHCPLLFTTKSNCDRHLLRKHGNIESATSVYVPTEDVTEPIPPPKSVEEIEKMQRQRDEEERKRKADKVREREEKERLEKEQQREKQQTQEQEQQQQQQQQHDFFKQLAAAQMQHYSHKSETSQVSSADLPFKCHLCESSFAERLQCLEHIKCMHAQDFALLLSKGAIDSDAETSQLTSNEEEERNGRGHEDGLKLGKYPDYSNRKVICAFCMRRFWSTEDLRRHMRTHSGERPFQCEICLRKFTLKHSMLRHMKKHNGLSASDDCQAGGDFSTNANSGSDYSDDEQTPTIQPNTPTAANNSLMLTPSMNASFIGKKIQELLNKANEWRSSNLNGLDEHKRNITEESNNMQHTDLIGNLLGISDQNMLNKLMSSPDEAAKLLGVDK